MKRRLEKNRAAGYYCLYSPLAKSTCFITMEYSIITIRLNRTFAMTLLILAIVVLFTNTHRQSSRAPPSSASAFHFWPFVKFHLNFKNQVRDTGSKEDVVMLGCSKWVLTATHGWASTALATQWITPNKEWGFSFMTSEEDMVYNCSFQCLGRSRYFDAFEDKPAFEDNGCGGRHCTWMFNNDGLFLFNLKDGKYHQQIKFTPQPTRRNNGTTSDGSGYGFKLGAGRNNSSGDEDLLELIDRDLRLRER